MSHQYKKCESCRRTKSYTSKNFFRHDDRCRKCVAREAGRCRSEKSRKRREEIRQQHGLKVGVSDRRYQLEQDNAQKKAAAAISMTPRDYLSYIVHGASILCLLGIPVLLITAIANGWHYTLFSVGAYGAFFLFVSLSSKLSEPRKTAVSTLCETILRDNLVRIEAEQLEYCRFYLTHEWRQVRAAVIKRDGKVCKHCRRRIFLPRDVTVDHILPRSIYPELALVLTNLQVLCRRCNSSKGAFVPVL
jgi:hypothetical protein